MTQWPRTGCEKKPGAQSCITRVSQRSCAFFPSDLEAVLWISFNVAFKISQLRWYFNCLLFCHAKIKSCPMPFPVLGSLCESPWVPQSTGFSKAANKILCLLIFVIRCWGRHGLNTKTPTGSTWFPCPAHVCASPFPCFTRKREELKWQRSTVSANVCFPLTACDEVLCLPRSSSRARTVTWTTMNLRYDRSCTFQVGCSPVSWWDAVTGSSSNFGICVCQRRCPSGLHEFSGVESSYHPSHGIN